MLIFLLDVEAPAPGEFIAIRKGQWVHRCSVYKWETYVKTPPSNGPATDAIPHILLIIPIANGLLRNGTSQVSCACLEESTCINGKWKQVRT